MATHRKTEKQFSLKDLLFNVEKVAKLAAEIEAVYPDFKRKAFEKKVVSAFPKEELMERIANIRDTLHEFLPSDYEQALAIILAALPSELDHEKADDDFGDFIYAPYSYFVAKYGCTKEQVDVSLKALEEITKRFSAEASLRDFINLFPDKTIKSALGWTKHKNYHVRRLASEGTRPNLPWAKKIHTAPEKMLPLLDNLYSDKTRYVTRSVANHLNDISKTNPALVVDTLKRWQKEGKQTEAELAFITKHALRTAVKRGDTASLKHLGYELPKVQLQNFTLSPRELKIGESLTFNFTVGSTASKSQTLLIDYLIHFKKANGKLSPKVFKLTSTKLPVGQNLSFQKAHTLKPMTTRTLYSGEHVLEIQINGQSFGKLTFTLL